MKKRHHRKKLTVDQSRRILRLIQIQRRCDREINRIFDDANVAPSKTARYQQRLRVVMR